MTSRRIVTTEKTLLDQDDATEVSSGSGAPSGDSSIAPAVPAFVHPYCSTPSSTLCSISLLA